MTPLQITREVLATRRRLVDLSERIAAGDAVSYEAVRDEADALTCLIEEAPSGKRRVIAYLLERYEALLRRLAH